MPIRPTTDADEYYVLPEEAFQLLPEEWQNHFQKMADDQRAVLVSCDKELLQITRISKSFHTLVALKHVQKRLAEYKFAMTADAILDLDILTTAFVITYIRLHHGENGSSGFSRNDLPEKFREIHDQILELRNKRFAHHGEHHSVSHAMKIEVENDRFEIKFSLNLGYYIGGAKEWHELVVYLEEMIVDKLKDLTTKLKQKTGREWAVFTDITPE